MVTDSMNACAQNWSHRWQAALVEASGPVRTARLTQGEMLKTGESGAIAAPQAFLGSEVVLGGEAVSERKRVGFQPRRDRDFWLRWLVGRADALQERLDTARMVQAEPSDEHLVGARLACWGDYVTPGEDKAAFARYLSFEGLDEAAALRAVVPVRWLANPPLPAWTVTLGDAVFTPCYDAPPGACDTQQPFPFEDLLLPFLNIYLCYLVSTTSAGYDRLLPAARRALSRHLLGTLSALARDALYTEFCRYRLADFAPLAPFVWSEPDALYRRFVAYMRSGGLLALFEAYPVLARRLAEHTDYYAAAVGEFLCRFATDLPEIQRLWEIADSGGGISEVAAGLSDPHRGGRQVFAVTFANGRRLIYKPKDMGIDVAYNALLTWLNAAGAPIPLRPLRVLDCHTHGWVEYAEPAPCGDRAAVTRYYQRAGALTCLAQLLQASDCHAENIIAAGEDPVLVDCETLLDPWPRAADRGEGAADHRVRLNRLMRDSVLTTGLLPGLGEEDERTFSTPGLCRPIRLAIRKRSNRWMRINTDRMAVVQVAVAPTPGANLPRVDGLPVDVGECVEPLIKGFSATYRFLMARRSDLLTQDGPLAIFRGQFVRFLFRTTHLYSVLSGLAIRPAALSDGVDHSMVFELLARAYLVSDQIPAGWPMLAAEREALLRGDVPFFGARTDQTALLLENGARIEDYFLSPSYDAVQAKLRNLNEADLAFQVGLIRAAIAVYVDLQARAAAAETAAEDGP